MDGPVGGEDGVKISAWKRQQNWIREEERQPMHCRSGAI